MIPSCILSPLWILLIIHPINSGATILEWREKKSFLSIFLITVSKLTIYISSENIRQSLVFFNYRWKLLIKILYLTDKNISNKSVQ